MLHQGADDTLLFTLPAAIVNHHRLLGFLKTVCPAVFISVPAVNGPSIVHNHRLPGGVTGGCRDNHENLKKICRKKFHP